MIMLWLIVSMVEGRKIEGFLFWVLNFIRLWFSEVKYFLLYG